MEAEKYYFFSGFNSESAKDLVEWIDSYSGCRSKVLEIHINSYGGSIAALHTILAAMDRSPHEIRTVASGVAMSCGFILFIYGDHRTASKWTSFMSHKPWTEIIGNEDEIRRESKHLEELTRGIEKIYKNRSNLSLEEVRKKLLTKEDRYISVNQMLECGLAEEIIG